MECNLDKGVWALENVNTVEFLSQHHCMDARAWLAEIMSSLDIQILHRLVVLLWAVWYGRRLAIHEN